MRWPFSSCDRQPGAHVSCVCGGGGVRKKKPLPLPPLSSPPSLPQVLVLSPGAHKSSAVGDVVNLLSVDVQRLSESVLYLNGLWLPLLWMVVCFAYLWQVGG